MARRRNSIAHRFARMKGLPPDEKALMQRIAHLIDSALNNRQSANPFEDSQNRVNRQVYPPTGLLVKQGIKSVKLIWNATNSNELLRYEVAFDNLTTGVRTVKSSFTNEVIFKAPAGTYIARIKSVGRDGSSSLVKQVQFSVDEDVMQIEGAKNGPLELGTMVQDNMFLLAGYSTFVWGSAILDKYIAAESNEKMVLRLWRAETPDAVWGTDTFVLQETITLYPATESASNLDDTARAGLITRPVAGFSRLGSFDTSQSVMFSPLDVDPADDHKTVTYLLQAINRETEQDEVCLSLVMWAGAQGDGSSVPGDPFTPAPDYVFPNLNSFHTQKVGVQDINNESLVPWDIRSMYASVDKEHQLIGNQWTIAMWLRFDSLNVTNLATAVSEGNPNGGDLVIWSRGAMHTDLDEYIRNSIDIRIQGVISSDPDQHRLIVTVGDRINGPGGATRFRTVDYWADVTGGDDNDASSGIFTWGGATSGTSATNDAWYFLVVCFSGGDFVGGVPKIRTYLNSVTAPKTTLRSTAGITPYMAQLIPVSGLDGSLNEVEQADNETMTANLGVRATGGTGAGNSEGLLYNGNLRYPECGNFLIHQFGMWNVCLDAVDIGQGATIGPIKTLFNEGHGTEMDWRVNSLTETSFGINQEESYWQAENLIHLIQYGAVEQPMSTGYPGRDTGYHLYEGDMNMTGTSIRWREDQGSGWLPGGGSPNSLGYTNTNEHWTDNTTIADIVSPEGTNGTTQFDFCYPGKNQTGGSG